MTIADVKTPSNANEGLAILWCSEWWLLFILGHWGEITENSKTFKQKFIYILIVEFGMYLA